MNLNKLLLCYIMLITMILSMEQPKEYLAELYKKALVLDDAKEYLNERYEKAVVPDDAKEYLNKLYKEADPKTYLNKVYKVAEDNYLEEQLQKMIRKLHENPNDPNVLKEAKAFVTDTLVHDSNESRKIIKIIGPYRDHGYLFEVYPGGSEVVIRKFINYKFVEAQLFNFDTFLKFPIFTVKIPNNEKFGYELQFSNYEYDYEKKEFNIVKENNIQYHFYVEDLFPELAKQNKQRLEDEREYKEMWLAKQNKQRLEDEREYKEMWARIFPNIHDNLTEVLESNDNQDITHDDSIKLEKDNKEQVTTKTKKHASCCTVV